MLSMASLPSPAQATSTSRDVLVLHDKPQADTSLPNNTYFTSYSNVFKAQRV